MHPPRIAITLLLALTLCVGAALQDKPHVTENGVSQVLISVLKSGVTIAEAKVHTHKNLQSDSDAAQEAARNAGSVPGAISFGDSNPLGNKTPPSEQEESETSNGDAQEKTEQRPNVYVPDKDEVQDEDEEKGRYDGFALIVSILLLVAVIVILIKCKKRRPASPSEMNRKPHFFDDTAGARDTCSIYARRDRIPRD